LDIEKLIREVTEEIGGQPVADSFRPAASAAGVVSKLEHSLLIPDLHEKTVLEACAEARRYGIAAVCIPPYFVSRAKQALRGSGVAVCAALGVPNALFSAEGRLADAKASLLCGADELDVSINAMAVKSGYPGDAEKDLADVVRAAKGKAAVKACVELALFSEEEKQAVLRMVIRCGAAYVKIQNVLSGKGADVTDIRFVRGIIGNNAGIKIDGGVKTLEKAEEIISGGADRIGLTATFKIAAEAER